VTKHDSGGDFHAWRWLSASENITPCVFTVFNGRFADAQQRLFAHPSSCRRPLRPSKQRAVSAFRSIVAVWLALSCSRTRVRLLGWPWWHAVTDCSGSKVAAFPCVTWVRDAASLAHRSAGNLRARLLNRGRARRSDCLTGIYRCYKRCRSTGFAIAGGTSFSYVSLGVFFVFPRTLYPLLVSASLMAARSCGYRGGNVFRSFVMLALGLLCSPVRPGHRARAGLLRGSREVGQDAAANEISLFQNEYRPAWA